MTGLLILVVNLLTCLGQICQKQAVESWRGQDLPWHAKLRNRWFIAGILSLGIGMLVWLAVLRRVPLGVAYPMLSLNYVLVALASRMWFREQISRRTWAGIACIMLGVVLIGVRP